MEHSKTASHLNDTFTLFKTRIGSHPFVTGEGFFLSLRLHTQQPGTQGILMLILKGISIRAKPKSIESILLRRILFVVGSAYIFLQHALEVLQIHFRHKSRGKVVPQCYIGHEVYQDDLASLSIHISDCCNWFFTYDFNSILDIFSLCLC